MPPAAVPALPAVRVAVAHLFATGACQPEGLHGLVHLGLLPLRPGAEVQEWVINPEHRIGKAVSGAAKVYQTGQGDTVVADQYAPWAEQRAAIQAAFADFDALLILDRAGEASPERRWLEQVVLAGQPRPVCVALDELLAFFCPGAVLDDAEEIFEKLLLPDKPALARLGWQEGKPRLPFLLHGLRRAGRLVLQTVLRPGPEAGLDFPVLALLQAALGRVPNGRKLPALRGFRLLAALAQQPDCCDEPAPEAAAPRSAPAYRLRRPPARLPLGVDVRALVAGWLERWHLAPEGTAEPEIGLADDLTAAQVDEAFAALRRQAAGAGHALKPRLAQQQYAHFVAHALNQRGAYALEAGTGTGKTFGYLVPLLEYLRRRPNAAAVVATSTKNLQDQMQTNELPALLGLGADGRRTGPYAAIRTAVLKGKNCYLCADALADNFGECFAPQATWQQALAWLYLALRLRETKGEIESIPRPVTHLLGPDLAGLRPAVAADRACRHEPRPDLKTCVFAAHRQRAEAAQLVITNHYKLLSLPKKLLERQPVCVVDEADQFPDNLRGALSRTFGPRELVQELLLPFLGYAHRLAPPRRNPARRNPPPPLLGELRERVADVADQLYFRLPPADRPRTPDQELAYERRAEADLQALTDQVALLEDVARAVADTPLAADARTSADAAGLAVQAAAEPLRQRQAVRAVQAALGQVAEPLTAGWEMLLEVGAMFRAAGPGAVARLPFGDGQAHWQDAQNAAPAGQPPRYRSFLPDLQAALAPLHAPLAEAAALLATIGQQLGPALALAAEAEAHLRAAQELFSKETAPRDPNQLTPDERLAQRTLRLVGQATTQMAVLARLLAETPCPDFIPIVERLWPPDDPLAWALVRQPANLWPYLTTVDPEAPAQPFVPAPGESSEAFALRRQAARQRRDALPGDPPLPLYEQFGTVVFTSATLYVQGELHYLRRLLDQPVPFAAEARIEAVFDYAGPERVVTGLPTGLPRFDKLMQRRYPPQHPAALLAWRTAQCRVLLALLLAFEGRTLVLFTSNDDLAFVADWLAPRLPPHNIELLVQPPGGASSQWQIRRFRRVEQSVLLGVNRMWAGVDFPGPTLGQVVVWRVPLGGALDPLASHRQRYQGSSVFWQCYARPAARLKMRQGFGRLVRREGDQGAFVLLDARLADTFYADILSELPLPCQPYATAEALVAAVVQHALPLLGLKGYLTERGLAGAGALLAAADG